MKQIPATPGVSLRAKLVLSYLGVALGAVIILAITVVLAVNSYFHEVEIGQIRTLSSYYAQQVEHLYAEAGNQWSNVHFNRLITPYFIVTEDAHGNLLSCNPPSPLDQTACNDPVITQALAQSLQGTEKNGSYSSSSNSFSGLYVSTPLYQNADQNGQVIGAVFIASPENSGPYPGGFSPHEFLRNVYGAIIATGLVIAAVVIIFSLLLARSLTRPLESLTVAAEQMKEGDYSRRVVPPKSQDELGRLAQTFNAMADTIETDVNELREQDQMRRDLIANIAHDLATPLTAIQGFSEALADEVIQTPQERHETAQLIGREVQRLRRLVADVQHMTSFEMGRAQLELAPLDMHVLVDETLAVIEPECSQAGITLRTELAPRTPLALADSDRITQVLLNLIDNARRHTPDGGTITVGAGPEGKMLGVWIRDTGIGIDPVDLPHIFERFYRADRSRTGATGGSGLGLSIVKAIITAHGGIIRAESKPSQGTCILFTLPLAPNTQLRQ